MLESNRLLRLLPPAAIAVAALAAPFGRV